MQESQNDKKMQLSNLILQITECLIQGKELNFGYVIKLNENIQNSELDDLIPQLCYLFYCTLNQNIADFLQRYAMLNSQNYFRLEWTLKAFNENGKNNVAQKYIDFYRNLKNCFVNNGLNSLNQISDQHFNDMFLIKDARATYQDRQEQLLFNLIEQSLLLKQIDIMNRKQNMKNFLKIINKNIEYQQRLLPPFYSGITIPFNFGLKESCLVVNIIDDEFICFNTAKRVPYKIIVETVSPIEIHQLVSGIDIEEQNRSQFDLRPVQDIEVQMGKISRAKIFSGHNIQELKSLAVNGFVQFTKLNLEKKKPIDQDIYASHNCCSDYWGEQWEKVQQEIQNKSKFRHYQSYQLRQIIIKGGDDLRSELLIMQMIKKVQQIFKERGLSIYLRPYDIVLTSPNSGILEFIPNTVSLDKIKRENPGISLKTFYQNNFKDFEKAQKNFAQSLAGYSIISYLFQLKDRHNGNILIDNEGHIIHIDFGFVLTLSPGNIGFESAPFKLIQEYVDLLGGKDSDLYFYYCTQVYSGFVTLQGHEQEILSYLKIMNCSKKDNLLICLENFEIDTIKQRFLIDNQLQNKVRQLIDESLDSWTTTIYDYYQFRTNQIYY